MKPNKALLKGTGSIFLNGLLYRNPLLIGALGLYPVVAAAWNLRNALAMSLLFLAVSLPTSLVLCMVGLMVPRWFRPGLVLLVSAAFYIPAGYLVNLILPGVISSLGMVAGLMICDSVIFSRAEEYAPEHVLAAVAADSLGCSAGFALVAFLVALLRSVWMKGIPLPGGGTELLAGRAADLPFAGFLLLGFLAALIQWVNSIRANRVAENRKKERP